MVGERGYADRFDNDEPEHSVEQGMNVFAAAVDDIFQKKVDLRNGNTGANNFHDKYVCPTVRHRILHRLSSLFFV